MDSKKISYSAAFSFGWDTLKNNFPFIIGVMVAYGLLVSVPFSVAMYYRDKSLILYLLATLADMTVSVIVQMGLIKILLAFYDAKKTRFGDLFSCAGLFFKYFFGSILYKLIVALGTLLLIVPGVIWLIQFSFYAYLIVDKAAGPIEALKQSAAVTKGVKWQLFIFGVLFFCINILGALALLVGMLITLPLTMLAAVFVYRKLLASTQIPPPAVSA